MECSRNLNPEVPEENHRSSLLRILHEVGSEAHREMCVFEAVSTRRSLTSAL